MFTVTELQGGEEGSPQPYTNSRELLDTKKKGDFSSQQSDVLKGRTVLEMSRKDQTVFLALCTYSVVFINMDVYSR